jgi:hypothetical protein
MSYFLTNHFALHSASDKENKLSDLSMHLSDLPARMKSRSMGVKLIVACGLALVMTLDNAK